MATFIPRPGPITYHQVKVTGDTKDIAHSQLLPPGYNVGSQVNLGWVGCSVDIGQVDQAWVSRTTWAGDRVLVSR